MNLTKKILAGLLVLCVLASSFAVFADEPEFPNDLAKKVYYGTESFVGEEDMTGSVEVTCDMEINLAGHSLTGDFGKWTLRIADGKNVTVKNAKLTAKGGSGCATIEVGAGATLTLESVAVVGPMSLSDLLGSGIRAAEGAKVILNNCFVFGDVALDNAKGAEITADDTYLLGAKDAMTDASVLKCSENFTIVDTAQWLADNYADGAADRDLLALVVTTLGLGKGIVSTEKIGEVKAQIAEDETKVTVTAKSYESKHHNVFSYKWVPQYVVLNDVQYPMEDGKAVITTAEADFSEGAEGYVHYVLSLTISDVQEEMLKTLQDFVNTLFPKLNKLDLRSAFTHLAASFFQRYLDVFSASMADAQTLLAEAYENLVAGNKLEAEALRQMKARAAELAQLIEDGADQDEIDAAQEKADVAAEYADYAGVQADVKNVADKLNKMAGQLAAVTNLFNDLQKLFNEFKNTNDLSLWVAENAEQCYEIVKQAHTIVVDASAGMKEFVEKDGPALDANYEILNERSLAFDGKTFEYDSTSSYNKVKRAQDGLADPMDLLDDILRYADVLVDNEAFWRVCDLIKKHDPEPKIEARLHKFLEQAPAKLAAMIADANSYEGIYEACKALAQDYLDIFIDALPDAKENLTFIAENFFTEEVYNACFFLVKGLAGDRIEKYPAITSYLTALSADIWSIASGNLADDLDAFILSVPAREDLFLAALDEFVNSNVPEAARSFIEKHYPEKAAAYKDKLNLAFKALDELRSAYPAIRPSLKKAIDTFCSFYPAFDEEADELRATMLDMLENDPDKFWGSLDKLSLGYINPYIHNEWVDVWAKNVPISVDPILPPPPPPTGDTVVAVAALAAVALLGLGVTFGKKRK